MNDNRVLFTEGYGQRVIIKRVYLKREDTDFEKLALLAQLLNLSPCYQDKKLLESYAGGKLTFFAYSFSSGYVLEGRLSQAQNKSLNFIFSDPYKKGLTIFNDVFELGFKKEEKNFETAKARVLDVAHLYNKDSSSFLEGTLNLPHCFPILDEKLLHDLTMDDESLLLETIKKSSCGTYIFLGQEPKSDVLALLPQFDTDFSDLNSSYAVTSESVTSGNFVNEDIGFVYSFDAIKDSKTLLMTQIAFKVLKSATQDYFLEHFNLQVNCYYHFINPNQAFFEITSSGSRLSLNYDLIIKELKNLNLDSYFAKAIQDEKLDQVRLAMDVNAAISKLILLQDFHLQDETFFTEPDVTIEEAKKLVSSLKQLAIFTAFKQKGNK
jgi:hypothetical protein